MATTYPIPDFLEGLFKKGYDAVTSAGAAIDEPLMWPFSKDYVGAGPFESLGKMMMPEKVQEAFTGGIMGLAPGYIAANYRSPEMLRQLRRAMAEENRARGGVKEIEVPNWQGATLRVLQGGEGPVYQNAPDPVDQILRGSWFHGMRPEARQQLGTIYDKKLINDPIWSSDKIITTLMDMPYDKSTQAIKSVYPNAYFNPKGAGTYTDDLITAVMDLEESGGLNKLAKILNINLPKSPVYSNPRGVNALDIANQYGLPGSTHAHPGYTRSGEPYGVSLTASPSVAAGEFSPDQMIHRVQPLYGGPPTQRIIPMWRPEGQKVMNEGYNAALNDILASPVPRGQWPEEQTYLSALMKNYGDRKIISRDPFDLNASIGGIETALNRTNETGKFNTMFSRALQDKGYRGILYSPQRYGEYEMLMLDPSYVRPLDYRKVEEYIPGYGKRQDYLSATIPSYANIYDKDYGITPKARKGYGAVEPEFSTGATRLSDVFSQQEWVDRLNEENKRRILEMIDSAYREQVGNQLFRR